MHDRSYSYDADTNRTKLVTRAPGSGGACDTTSTGTTKSYGYDAGDRLTGESLVYDDFGRVTSLPSADGRQLSRLRPSPRKALILADFHTSTAEAVSNVVPKLEETLERQISSPVRATQTGYASLSRGIQRGGRRGAGRTAQS